MHFRSEIFLRVPAVIGIVVGLACPSYGETFVYPNKGQSAEQEDKDKYACHEWAVKQTGVDPTQPAQSYQPAYASAHEGGLLRGGARGAALGAVGGAIGGDAGKGAAIGAAVGALGGIFRRRQEVMNQYARQEQEAAVHRNAVQAYDRAYDTCLKGRGYTVG